MTRGRKAVRTRTKIVPSTNNVGVKMIEKYDHRSALILCFSAEMDSAMSITGRAFHNLITLLTYKKFR